MRLSRRQDEIQSRLSERRERFRNWVGIGMPFENLRVGFRITALPVGGPLHIERVFNVRDVSRNFDGVRGTWRKDATNSSTKDFPSCVSLSERPVLGGTAWVSSPSSERSGEKRILRDGLIDIWFKWPWYKAQNWSATKPILHLDWIIAESANAIASADVFRRAAQSPGCEYGLQLELLGTNGPAEISVQLVTIHHGFHDPFDSAMPTPAILGPYSIGDRDTVMNLIVRDLLDASGVSLDWPKLEIDWASA